MSKLEKAVAEKQMDSHPEWNIKADDVSKIRSVRHRTSGHTISILPNKDSTFSIRDTAKGHISTHKTWPEAVSAMKQHFHKTIGHTDSLSSKFQAGGRMMQDSLTTKSEENMDISKVLEEAKALVKHLQDNPAEVEKLEKGFKPTGESKPAKTHTGVASPLWDNKDIGQKHKGVHLIQNQGASFEGTLARQGAATGNPHMKERAMDAHKKVHSEIKAMGKPNLPKSEIMASIKKCGDMIAASKAKKAEMAKGNKFETWEDKNMKHPMSDGDKRMNRGMHSPTGNSGPEGVHKPTGEKGKSDVGNLARIHSQLKGYGKEKGLPHAASTVKQAAKDIHQAVKGQSGHISRKTNLPKSEFIEKAIKSVPARQPENKGRVLTGHIMDSGDDWEILAQPLDNGDHQYVVNHKTGSYVTGDMDDAYHQLNGAKSGKPHKYGLSNYKRKQIINTMPKSELEKGVIDTAKKIGGAVKDAAKFAVHNTIEDAKTVGKMITDPKNIKQHAKDRLSTYFKDKLGKCGMEKTSEEGKDMQAFKTKLKGGQAGVHQRNPQVTVHNDSGKYLEGATMGRSRLRDYSEEGEGVEHIKRIHAEAKKLPKPNLPKSEMEKGDKDIKGVHTEINPVVDQGASHAGRTAMAHKKAKAVGHYSHAKEMKDTAKRFHAGVKEEAAQIKPNLPKSEKNGQEK